MEKYEVPFMEGVYKENQDGSIVLIGGKCRKCGSYVFPAGNVCHICLSNELDKVELSTRGTLHTFTVTRMPVQKFPIPHYLGQINLPEKVRIYAPLIPDDYEIGDSLELVKDTLWEEEDHTVVGYKFKKIAE